MGLRSGGALRDHGAVASRGGRVVPSAYTHELLEHLHEQGIRFSVGMDMTEDVRQAVAASADEDWIPAITKGGEERERAFVCELSLDLSRWPAGARAICRREGAHPGAQLSLIDIDGWRHQVFMTDQASDDIAQLDLTQRARARVEDRIRCAKQTGLEKLPFRDFELNEVWLEFSLIAQDLIAWTKPLTLGRAPKRRAKAASLPAASPGRADRPLGAQDAASARALVAVGGGARSRVRAHPGAPVRAGTLTSAGAQARTTRVGVAAGGVSSSAPLRSTWRLTRHIRHRLDAILSTSRVARRSTSATVPLALVPAA